MYRKSDASYRTGVMVMPDKSRTRGCMFGAGEGARRVFMRTSAGSRDLTLGGGGAKKKPLDAAFAREEAGATCASSC